MTKNETAQLAALKQIGGALLEAIVALGSIPSGHLYARLMGKISLDTYNKIIEALVAGGLLTNTAHLLEPTDKARALIARGGQ